MFALSLFSNIAKGGGNLMSAWGDHQSAGMSGKMADFYAGEEEKAGQEMAGIIRRAGERLRSSQVAAYAGAGVKVGEGSAATVEGQTVVDTEHDAYQAILGGQRRALALRTQSKMQKISAKAAWMSTLIDPLFANTSAFSGWKTFQPPQQQYSYNGDQSGMEHSQTGADIMARR